MIDSRGDVGATLIGVDAQSLALLYGNYGSSRRTTAQGEPSMSGSLPCG
jgi:hypothetical protein